MDAFDDSNWDHLLDYSSFINDVPSDNLYWPNQGFNGSSPGLPLDAQFLETITQNELCTEQECPKKRARNGSCSGVGTKACRERLRREKLNEKFLELSSTLEPGRPAKTDKLAILGDAIRVVNQLRAESQEYKETNEKLLEEIKSLKAEKNELREEKTALKAEKEKMEQQMNAVAATPSPGFLPPHPAAYQAGPAKMAVYPSYGFMPMWQYMTPSARDTSQDQNLRPPAA